MMGDEIQNLSYVITFPTENGKNVVVFFPKPRLALSREYCLTLMLSNEDEALS